MLSRKHDKQILFFFGEDQALILFFTQGIHNIAKEQRKEKGKWLRKKRCEKKALFLCNYLIILKYIFEDFILICLSSFLKEINIYLITKSKHLLLKSAFYLFAPSNNFSQQQQQKS